MESWLLVVLSTCVASTAAFNFTLTDCLGTHKNQLFRVNNMSLSPSVIHLPGQESGYLDLDILRNISGHHYQMNVTVSKSMFRAFVDLPCISGLGSCTYDLCTLLDMYKDHKGVTHCPPELQQNNFPCTCPLMAGNYRINPVTFQLYKLSSIYSAMASGDFKIHIKLTDTKTGNHVGCYEVLATIDTGCTGLACIIGRK